MATVSKWTPFGVALNLSATASSITRTSATQFTVKFNVSWSAYWDGAETNFGMKAVSGGVTKVLNAFATYSSGSSGSFTGTFSISGNGAQTKEVTVTFTNWEENWQGTVAQSAAKSIKLSVKVPAWTSYKVTYNANGGTGAPGSQTKWKDQTLKLSTTKPTRTGYTFQGWATSASGGVAYVAGANYTTNAGVTLYAVWKANTWTVKYDANGGTGAPASQTKTYGQTLTLSSTKPTRTNYNFKGWGTSASATTVAYAAGASYTANAGITLYAIWELAYAKPRIVNLSVDRCMPDGTLNEAEGTNALVTFKWQCDKTVSSITVTWESDTGGTGSATISASGTSGTVSTVIGSNAFSLESSYTLHVTVADSNGSFTKDTFLTGLSLPIDVLAENRGISFGKPAELAGYADFGYHARFTADVIGNVFGLGRLVPIPSNANVNDYFTTGCYAVPTNVIAGTITNLPAKVAGRFIVADSTGGGTDASSSYAYRQQIFLPYQITHGIFIRDITQGSSGAYTYGGWYKISLTAV